MVNVSPGDPGLKSTREAEHDWLLWVECFKLAITGAASATGYPSPEKLVERAELVASAAVAALNARAATAL